MKKNNKKTMKIVKCLTIVFTILLLSMISFFGVYTQNKNKMSNKIKNYQYAMSLNGSRTITLTVDSDEKEENKTEKNYEESKKILEKRLKKLNIQEYNISVDKTTGKITMEIPENINTDSVVGNVYVQGKFEMLDTETNDVLLDNNQIKSSEVLYNNAQSGTSVYLQIEFNKEGKQKLAEITKTYVKNEEKNNTEKETTENSEATEETKEKTITMKINDEEIMSTAFEEPIENGKIQLSVGTASTERKTLEGYIKQAQNIATILDSGKLPVDYKIEKNEYILSNITEQDIINIAIVVAIIIIISVIVLTIKYKLNGLLAGIAQIGLLAIYMLTIRYTNVLLSIESIFGIITILVLNYIFNIMLLKNINENDVNKATKETYIKYFIRIIPICIMVIAFCFIKWVPINSFGMTSFWGITIIAIYNAIVTRTLLRISAEDK